MDGSGAVKTVVARSTIEVNLRKFFEFAMKTAIEEYEATGLDPCFVLVSRRMVCAYLAYVSATGSDPLQPFKVTTSAGAVYSPESLNNTPGTRIILDDLVETGETVLSIKDGIGGSCKILALASRGVVEGVTVFEPDLRPDDFAIELIDYLTSQLRPTIGDLPVSAPFPRNLFKIEACEGWNSHHLPQMWKDTSIQHVTYLPTQETIASIRSQIGGDLGGCIGLIKVRAFISETEIRIVPIGIPGGVLEAYTPTLRECARQRLLAGDRDVERFTKSDGALQDHRLVQLYLSTIVLVRFFSDHGLDSKFLEGSKFLDERLVELTFGDRQAAIQRIFDASVKSAAVKGKRKDVNYFSAVPHFSVVKKMRGIHKRQIVFERLHTTVSTSSGQVELNLASRLLTVLDFIIELTSKEGRWTNFVTFDTLRERLPTYSEVEISLAVDLGCDLGIIVAETVAVPDDGVIVICRRLRKGENGFAADLSEGFNQAPAKLQLTKGHVLLETRLLAARAISEHAAKLDLGKPQEWWVGTLDHQSEDGQWIASLTPEEGNLEMVEGEALFPLNTNWGDLPLEAGSEFNWFVYSSSTDSGKRVGVVTNTLNPKN
jgi:hypothetical protein